MKLGSLLHLLYVDSLYAVRYNYHVFYYVFFEGDKVDIIKVFGSNVRKYRTEKGVSQEKFAELCGLHRTYISDIECFRRSISLDNIQKIADALEIETYKLFLEQ